MQHLFASHIVQSNLALYISCEKWYSKKEMICHEAKNHQYGGNFLSRRLLALLLAAVLMITGLVPTAFAAEADPETEEDVWKDPELSPNAIPWDEKHPELLDPSMLYAQSAILIEASTGEVLFEKNADELMYPASTTKVMTALIVLENIKDLEEVPENVRRAITIIPAENVQTGLETALCTMPVPKKKTERMPDVLQTAGAEKPAGLHA